MGDLDHFAAYRAFERDVGLYERLLRIRPACVAHDLHPDYASTRYALERARREGIPAVAVQHHHAHVVSCMVEHGLTGPVIGVSFDGTGFGTDGAIWGGEFLIADLREFRRAGHIRYVPMPGGDRAIREPWRMAVAHLDDAGADCPRFWQRLPTGELRTVRRMVERRINSPMTSSAGRLFDTVAALVGVRERVTFEGQAAMELEWLAGGVNAEGAYPFEIVNGPMGEESHLVDVRPLIRAIAREVEAGVPSKLIARRFHRSIAEVILRTCERLHGETGINTVVLSGGVFMNLLLMEEVTERLREFGFCPFHHRLVPTNDGGISLGQLAIAACRSATK
jgi:hydrogenase maturation protein HypF